MKTSAPLRRVLPAREQHPYRKARAGVRLTRRHRQAMAVLGRKLLSTLEPEAMLRMFAQTVRRVVPFDGLRLVLDGEGLTHEQGVQARHVAEYGLRINGHLLGTLRLMRERPFAKAELEVFEELLALLLFALRNALLYRHALRLASRDPLTGVGNRLAFDEALAREIERARRHQGKLALMMLDLDDFKGVNDRYGHPAGDALLKHFAAQVKTAARGCDMLFRFGGDEFALLMPETDLEGARQLVGRLMEVLEQSPLRWKDASIALRSSIGVAQWQPGEDAAALLARADAALYEDKHRRA